VAPGPTIRNERQSDADFARQRDATILAAVRNRRCLRRRALSARRPATTGQLIAVDGGQHLIWQTPDVRVRE